MSTGGPIRTGSLTKAVFKFADSIINRDKRYAALEAILNRSIPNIKGHSAGQPIVNPERPDLKEIIEAVAGLRNSYLFIQGPPGTGKTYTGSHIIAELLRQRTQGRGVIQQSQSDQQSPETCGNASRRNGSKIPWPEKIHR